MKQLCIFIVIIFCCKIIFAQQADAPKTYALIIGVAKYLDPAIPQLQFSNRDATIFADFLKSKAGGYVPKENIRLLVDEAATSGAVINAIYWLKDVADKGDRVYIYFSGHGDLENITMFNNGFLICYDSPPFNYVNLALSIDYLNDIANTISIKKQANVIMITDACHSGKMAEKRFKGNFLAADQLRKVRKKEIRITSSSTDQLSNEKADWGGGRGVFSYYLINGLKGLAAKSNTSNVTLDDIKSYLDSSLKNDLVLKQDSTIQTPVVNGNGNFVLSQIDSVDLITAKKEITADTLMQRAMMVALGAQEEKTPDQYFYDLLKQYKIEYITDSFNLNEVPKEKIPFVLIDSLISEDNTESGKNKLRELKQTLSINTESLKEFKNTLATLFDEAGQRVITLYLRSDAAELERRKYYNVGQNGYNVYPRMFEVALKLISPDNTYYYNNLRVKLHYFTGVTARLKINSTEKDKQKQLIEAALAEQKKALALEEHAAYIYNELGVLYSLKNNDAEAEKYFKIAALRAPNWAIPRSNLADLYTDKGRLEKAIVYADSAKELQPDFNDIYMSYGLIYEKQAKLLQAEEAFQKNIKLNSGHFLPFERLGYMYMNTGQFAQADSFFFEAAKRKKGFFFDETRNPRHMKLEKPEPVYEIQCNIDSAYTGSNDIMGQFALGYLAYRDYELAKAERAFKRVIALDKKNPLAYHYLGRVLADQQRWQEAELVLKLAIDNYLPDTVWFIYHDSLLNKSSMSNEFILSPCADSCFYYGYYHIGEDYLLMAQVYENWNHFSESETYYRKFIADNPSDLNSCMSLTRLFEKTGKFNDAENLLNAYYVRNGSGATQITDFYKRVTDSFPDNAEWNLKAGIFQYNMAKNHPDSYTHDLKKLDEFSGEVVYQFSDRQAFKMAPQAPPRLIPYGTVVKNYKIKASLKPLTDGIKYLKNAITNLLYDEMVLADVNTKIGDLYAWQGLPDSAAYFYDAALQLNTADAGTRNKLVEIYAHSYRFAEALVQLNTLLKHKELNIDKQLLLAAFYMQDGRFADAEKLLNDAEKIIPVFDVALTTVKAKLAVMTNDFKKAIETYNSLYLLNNKNSIILYNLTRLYALSGNKQQAWKWLDLALKAGFNYGNVLQYDPALKNLRKENTWGLKFNNFKVKNYSFE